MQVSTKALQAALISAGVNDIRFYLNAVFINAITGEVVATNGHTLFIMEQAATPASNKEAKWQIIIPSDCVSNIIKQAARLKLEYVELTQVKKDLDQIRAGNSIEEFTPIPAKYVDYHRVIKDRQVVATESVGFAVAYMNSIVKMVKVFNERYLSWNFAGDNSTSCTTFCADHAKLYIMPVRHNPAALPGGQDG